MTDYSELVREAREQAAMSQGGLRKTEMRDTLRRLADALEEAEKLGRLNPDHNLRCQGCGAPHWLDTSLPSEIWNQIAMPSDTLCLLCIDERLTKAGIETDQAEFYFVGRAMRSKLYTESHGCVAAAERRADAAEAEAARLRTAVENAAQRLNESRIGDLGYLDTIHATHEILRAALQEQEKG